MSHVIVQTEAAVTKCLAVSQLSTVRGRKGGGRSSSSEKQIGRRGQGGVNKAGARNESQGAHSSRAIAARRNGRRRVGGARKKGSPARDVPPTAMGTYLGQERAMAD